MSSEAQLGAEEIIKYLAVDLSSEMDEQTNMMNSRARQLIDDAVRRERPTTKLERTNRRRRSCQDGCIGTTTSHHHFTGRSCRR